LFISYSPSAEKYIRITKTSPTPVILAVVTAPRSITTVSHVDDRHCAVLVIDPVDHAISTTAGTEPVVHRREQPLADPMRICEQRSCDEFISGRRNGLRKRLAQRATGG